MQCYSTISYYCTILSYCTTVLLYHCLTVLLYHCLTVPLPYCTTVPLPYCTDCTTVLLYHCLTVLLSYCTTVPLPYCTTVQLYHCLTVPLSYCTTVLLYHYLTVLLYHCLTVLLYHCLTVCCLSLNTHTIILYITGIQYYKYTLALHHYSIIMTSFQYSPKCAMSPMYILCGKDGPNTPYTRLTDYAQVNIAAAPPRAGKPWHAWCKHHSGGESPRSVTCRSSGSLVS